MNKILVLILILISPVLYSQVVYQHVSSISIYEFIDELASEKIIDPTTVVKPYSRREIAEFLTDAGGDKEKLSKRQQKDLEFYQREFAAELNSKKIADYAGIDLFKPSSAPDRKKNRYNLFYYKDSIFTFTVNPILGVRYTVNDAASVYQRWNGASATAYVGKNWGFYANLRDNYQSKPMNLPSYLVPDMGGAFKGSEKKEGNEFEEMRGGFMYSWNWGEFGIVKDNFIWGNNNHGANIFTDKIPSPAMMKLRMHPARWFDFNYIHAWLVSNVTDSLRSYNYAYGTRTVMYPKYLAANFFTFKPIKNYQLSIGNSIVYSNVGIHPGYLIPVMFFKAVDHSINGVSNNTGQNSQMFADLSARPMKGLHLYASMYMDEMNISNIWDDSMHTNYWSYKAGFSLGNHPIKNLIIQCEFTRTNPCTYQHFIPTTTFTSNLYNMGHYLRDNSQEIYFALIYKPIRGLKFKASYTYAEKGKVYTYHSNNSSIFGLPFIDQIEWSMETISIRADYEITNDFFINAEFILPNAIGKTQLYSPEIYRAKNPTVSVGINFGF